MARNFVVTRPQEADAPRIAEIHLAAMDANPLLHAQFPAPDSREALRRFLGEYAAEELRHPASGVLVAREPETGAIAGFAKWDSPSHPESVKLESGDMRNLEGCRREFVDGYVALAEQAKKRCFDEAGCYCMSHRVFSLLSTLVPSARRMWPRGRELFSARAAGSGVPICYPPPARFLGRSWIRSGC
jgi:hypothetical protein